MGKRGVRSEAINRVVPGGAPRPRYFINFDGNKLDEDDERAVPADANEARVQAVILAADYLRDRLVWYGTPFTVPVVDERHGAAQRLHYR